MYIHTNPHNCSYFVNIDTKYLLKARYNLMGTITFEKYSWLKLSKREMQYFSPLIKIFGR